jgi:putative transposase
MDSQEIPVRVLAPRDTEPRKYWQTTAIDEATRMVMATVFTKDRPNSADVAACIATGIRGFTTADGTFVGGVPEQIVWDNAGEFLADHITDMALRLAFTGTAVTPWAPYEKGKIEAWHKTIQTEFFAKLPGNSHGPRSFAQHEMWRPANRELLTGDLLVAHGLLWVEQYNTTRPHGGLAGRTPLEAWRADATPLRLATVEALYDAMLTEGTRKVGKNGIRFRNIDYVSADLNGHVGRRVEIRFLPHDDTYLEVFAGGKHVGTVFAAGRLSAEQRAELLLTRREQYITAKHLMTEAARLRQVRYEDAVVNGEAQLPPLSAQPAGDRRAADPAALLALNHEPTDDEQGEASDDAEAGARTAPGLTDSGVAVLLGLASAPDAS